MNDHKNVRQHILDTGKVLIAGKGFASVGLNELLMTAGVPKGSFYHYFKSKEAFGEALLEDYFADYCTKLTVLLFPVASTDRTVDRLMAYWQHWIDAQLDHELQEQCLVVKLSGEVCDLSDCMRAVLKQGTDRVEGILADAITAAINEGSLSPELHPQETATMLYELWLGATLLTKIRRDDSALQLAFKATRHKLHLSAE